MLASFSALNEISNSESSKSSTEESEEIPEFEDDDFLVKYNDALTRYGREDFAHAERKFRNLLESEYFKQCGYESQKPRPVAVKLQYNSYRYLGLCLGNQESYEECLDCLQSAINIDGTDRTLYFKLAVFATKFGKYHMARSALETSLSLDSCKRDQRSFPNVQHWPTVDLLISLTYKVGDFISALKYIHLALSDDPKYARALKVRQLIFEENPWLNPDESKHNDVPIIHSVIVSQPKKLPEIVVTNLTITAPSVTEFGICLVNEYTKHGPTDQILAPYTISIVEKSKTEKVVEHCEPVSEEKEPDAIHPEPENEYPMEVDEETDVEVTSLKIVEPLVHEIITQLMNPSVEDFMREIFYGLVDDAVTTSVENPGPARRRGGVGSFFNEVPLDLIEKRRSARYKSYFNETEDFMRNEDITAKSLLESFLPDSLKTGDDQPVVDAKQPEGGHQKNENSDQIVGISTVSESDETSLMLLLMESKYSEKFSLLDGLSDFLISVAEKFAQSWWPIDFCDTYLKCYLCWRRHFVTVEEEEHPYIGVITLANEIIIGESYLKEQVTGSAADGDPLSDIEDPVLEFIENDLDHLKLNLFHVPRQMAIRIFSLHIQFYKWQDMTSEALSISENLNDFLNNFCDQQMDAPFSPVESYQLICRSNLDSFLESLKQHTMITKVSSLFAEKDYQTVKLILSAYLTKKKRKATQQKADYSLRAYHVSMMIESLWNLQNYEECLKWSEQGFHEILEANKSKKDSTMSDMETSEEILDFLKMVECCVILQNGKFDGLDCKGRSRLSKNLLEMILEEVEGSESTKLKVKTVLPWMVMYKLILSEESKVEEDSDLPCVPGSLEFLCSAHDYLGPQTLCTIDSGHLLRVLVETTVKWLFKVKGQRSQIDHLSKHLDQALYCLYAHPCKKSKLKHLIDHNAQNVAFTWDQCIPPYVYLRPEKLPEFDDFKSNSISADTMTFYKRVVAVVPDEFDLEGREACVVKFLQSDSDSFPKFKCQTKEDFPSHLLDLFYLLADYFFKNNEFPTAIKYYKIDLTFNNRRIDSWISFALALGSGLEPKINETVKSSTNIIERITPDVVKEILAEGEETLRCFKACLRLSPRNSTIQIESANFTYMLSSFCLRLLSEDSETMSMEFFNRIDLLKKYFLEFAEDHYNMALNIFEEQKDDSADSDERWLLHAMKGKIFHKRKLSIEVTLNEYLKALDNLVSQGAGPLPKKISFNSPQEFSLEMLEVLYRIYSAILKDEFNDHEDVSDERNKKFIDVLDKVDAMNLFVIESKTSKDEPTPPSEPDAGCDQPPEKKAKLDELDSSGSDLWKQISLRCQKALDHIVCRFPQHFKAMHCLSRYHLKSAMFKDLQKSLRYLWSNEGNVLSANGQLIKINALFAEKKTNNLFNGFWRYPISEFDRAGNFSTHVNKCTTTLLELALKLNEYKILLEVACQLKRPADNDRKYLFERDRLALEQQALVLMRQVVRSKLEAVIAKQASEEEDKLLEEKGNFLFDCFIAHGKIKRIYQTKDETFSNAMVELFSNIVEKPKAKLEEAMIFCSRIQAVTSAGSKKVNQESIQVTAKLIRDVKESLRPAPIPAHVLPSPSKQPQLQRSLTDLFSGADVNAAALATLAVSGTLKAPELNRIYEMMRLSMLQKTVNNAAISSSEPSRPKSQLTSQNQSGSSKQSSEVLIRNKASGSVIKPLANRMSMGHSPVAKKPTTAQKQALIIKQISKQTLLSKQMQSASQISTAKQTSGNPDKPGVVRTTIGPSQASVLQVPKAGVAPLNMLIDLAKHTEIVKGGSSKLNQEQLKKFISDQIAARKSLETQHKDVKSEELARKIALQKQMALKRQAEVRKSLDSLKIKSTGQQQPSVPKKMTPKPGISTFNSMPDLSRFSSNSSGSSAGKPNGESPSVMKPRETAPKSQQPSAMRNIIKGQGTTGLINIPGVTLTRNPTPVLQGSAPRVRAPKPRPNLPSGPSVQITSSSLTVKSASPPVKVATQRMPSNAMQVRVSPSLTIRSVGPQPIASGSQPRNASPQVRPAMQVVQMPTALIRGTARPSIQPSRQVRPSSTSAAVQGQQLRGPSVQIGPQARGPSPQGNHQERMNVTKGVAGSAAVTLTRLPSTSVVMQQARAQVANLGLQVQNIKTPVNYSIRNPLLHMSSAMSPIRPSLAAVRIANQEVDQRPQPPKPKSNEEGIIYID